jgi:hypothetical protein
MNVPALAGQIQCRLPGDQQILFNCFSLFPSVPENRFLEFRQPKTFAADATQPVRQTQARCAKAHRFSAFLCLLFNFLMPIITHPPDKVIH